MPSFLFIQPEHENIGLEYVSAVLRQAGHQTALAFVPRPFSNTSFHIRDEDEEKENARILAALDQHKPDVAAFSPFTSQFRWCVRKARAIKQHAPKTKILFGGIHATFIPESVIKEPCVDALIQGEAEGAILDYAERFHDPKALAATPNLWLRQNKKITRNPVRPLISDLDTLPYPHKELFYDQFPRYQKRGTFTFMASRGCPNRCTYCCNDVYRRLYKGSRYVRFQSPEYVVEQLAHFKKLYNFKRVDFMDDVFSASHKRLQAILPLYSSTINLPFVCFMYPSRATIQDRVISLLKEHGCSWLKIGVQSASETYRRDILLRKETNAMLLELAALCHKHKLSFSFDHILHLPGETPQDLEDAITLYNEARPRIINSGPLIYLPKTRIIEHGIQTGEIQQEDIARIESGQDPTTLDSNMARFASDTPAGAINYRMVTLLFILISLLPKGPIRWLLRRAPIRSRFKPPAFILIFLKVLAKIRARQGYVYFSALRNLLHHGLLHRR